LNTLGGEVLRVGAREQHVTKGACGGGGADSFCSFVRLKLSVPVRASGTV
jgi:hypothetical protein